MKIVTEDSFVIKGGYALPAGPWRGVAIHSSSEVDIVDIGGYRLTVGGVAPLVPGQAPTVRPLRASCGLTGYLTNAADTALDGNHVCGEKLALALYEECDSLVPCGPRVPVLRHWAVGDGALPTTANTAQCVFRVPMQGRARCAISFGRDEDLDLHIYVLGKRRGPFVDAALFGGFAAFVAPSDSPYSWRTAGVPPASIGANYGDRQLNFENERFDELMVYAYAQAGGSGSSYFSAEAYGESA